MTQSYDGTSGNDYFAARMTPNQYDYYRWEPWFIHDYEGDDTLIGGQKNDSLYGGADNDRLEGKDGRDLLDGGSGYDTMFGGADSDIYVVDQWSDRIYENANEGIDTVISHSFSYKLADHVEELRLSTWGRSPGGSTGWGYHGYGNDQANKLYGNVKNNKLRGYGGADLLVGDTGQDTLEGGTGSDALDGGSGADRMYGGTQNDVYYVDSWSDAVYEYAGEGDNDVVYSYSFSYRLALNVERLYLSEGASPYGSAGTAYNGYGNEQNNLIEGNNQHNILTSYGGDDTLKGHEGDDTLSGGEGADQLYGSGDNDLLGGWDGNDSLYGGSGNDQLLGEAGRDLLVGHYTPDALYGGEPNSDAEPNAAELDTLTGGGDADIFALGSVDDVYYSGSGYAVITDFSQVEGDQIWVHGSLDDYVLDTRYGPGGSSEQDTHIFRNGDLMGVVQGNTEVTLGTDIISAPVP